MSALRSLSQRFPEAGLDPSGIAPHVSKDPKTPGRMAAAQAFIKHALKANPGNTALARRLLSELRLPGSNPTVKGLALKESARHSGRGAYDSGERAIAKLYEFSKDPEQLKDIAGMVAAGDSLDQAIAKERAELKRPVQFKAPQSVKAQAKTPAAKARALAQRAGAARAKIANAWRRLSHITRGAEASIGGTKAALLVPQVAKAVIDAKDERSLHPLYELAHEGHVTGQYLSGHLAKLQQRTDAAYLKVVDTLNSIESAYKEMASALSKTPPDTLAANGAQKRAQVAAKVVDKQVADFRNLASEYAAANQEFDHQVVHTTLEVLLSAASAGLGAALSSAGGSAPHAVGEVTKMARAAEFALEAAEHLALDVKVNQEAERAGRTAGWLYGAAKHLVE